MRVEVSPTLSISILASDRPDTLRLCLDSIKPLMEAVSCELILTDTSKNPKVRELLLEYSNQVYEFEWCNDFAKARNVGLRHATGEWFMVIDDDEWFEDVTPLIQFFLSKEADEYDQAVYKVRNYADMEGTIYSDSWISRIIRREEDTHYHGKVHEMLIPARGKCKKIDAFVHHYGYVGIDADTLKEKALRNLPMIQDMIKEEPDNMRWRIHLLQEYDCLKDAKALMQAAKIARRDIENMNDPFVNQCRGTYQVAELMGYYYAKDYQALYETGRTFLNDSRNTKQVNCAISFQMFLAAMELGDVEMKKRASTSYVENYNWWKQEKKTEQESLIEETLTFVSSGCKEELYQQMLTQMIVVQNMLGEEVHLSEVYEQDIFRYITRLLANRADFLILPEEVWEMTQAGIGNLEEQILELEIAQWIALVEVLKSKGMGAFEEVFGKLCAIQTKDDIRYRYIAMHYYRMLVNEPVTSEEEVVNELYAFAQASLMYYQALFKEIAFQGELEMLPADAKASVYLSELFSCEEKEWERKFKVLKSALKAYPPLAERIKIVAALLEKAQEESTTEAVDELAQMASQMKANIRLMIESGMKKEALQVITQLKQIVGADEELAELEAKCN